MILKANEHVEALQADLANCLNYILDELDGTEREIALKFRVICHRLLFNAVDPDKLCDVILQDWDEEKDIENK